MSRENVEVVKRLVAAVQAADLEAAIATLASEIEIEDTDILDADHYRGHDGFLKWVERWSESWESWTLEDIDVLPAGEDHAVALFRMVATGRGSGIEMARGDAIVCQLRRREIVQLTYYNDQQQALKAVGLAE
jgi:ketosteroid isomerase-like protein